jgi:hypothetical protein
MSYFSLNCSINSDSSKFLQQLHPFGFYLRYKRVISGECLWAGSLARFREEGSTFGSHRTSLLLQFSRIVERIKNAALKVPP